VTGARLALLAAASLVAPVVQTTEFISGEQIDVHVVAVCGGILFLLVVARMAGLMRMQDRTERRFSSLVQNSSDVVTVIGADSTIRYVSPSSERVLGYRSIDLVGTAFVEIAHPDDRERALIFFRATPTATQPDGS
jgi:PAS domain-containing protein